MVGSYPSAGEGKGKDYSEYSKTLAYFIRDVRKDLSAPKMPFITGVMGVGGENANEGNMDFRKAMAAPAEMEEFKGNVANVFTEKYWPSELDVVDAKVREIKGQFNKRYKELKAKKLSKDENNKEKRMIDDEVNKLIEIFLSKDDKFLLEVGKSNQGFHYWGICKVLWTTR